ncbi:hypothetical protein HPB52_019291 [Rhipicephalus sanguineus]|uniref:Uncharacterized protein n=1 Tax=Rhipicephalus sanguineus TaxID=34632 RepID=A0A9D4T1B1_RHISA|nr:hypothetical protein HPB52_019291 [Rhipicephalus sanguineus]
MEESMMSESEMSVVHPPQQSPDEDDSERKKQIAAIVSCCILLLFLLLYFVISTLFVDDELYEDISGLICHTVVDSYLTFAVPDGCDFFIADVVIAAPAKHPLYSPYMATVHLKNATQKAAVMKRMQLAPAKGLILMVNRSALRPKNPQARPQAIVRGILQIVTDINADGVGLTDRGLREADVKEIKSDADSEYIKRDIIDSLSQNKGAKAVALSMSLRVRKCAKYSLDGHRLPNCTELPLDYKHVSGLSLYCWQKRA